MADASPEPVLSRRPFGATGLLVDPLCIGCAELGNMPETFAYAVEEAQALATIRAIFQGPINFIDTAASYGDGESERRIGLVLRELGGVPAGYVVATKADRDLQTGNFSGDQIRRSIERSLRLLGLDYLPLLYLHDPEHAPFEDIMAPGGAVDVMRRLVEQGVVGHIGVAGGPADLMIRYVETGAFEAVITHNRYALLNRSADRPLRQRHPGERTVRLPPLRLPGSGRRHYRTGPPYRSALPGCQGTYGGGSFAILAARPTYPFHHRRHVQAGADAADRRPGERAGPGEPVDGGGACGQSDDQRPRGQSLRLGVPYSP